MIIKMEATLTFLMLVFAQQAPSLTWAPAVSLEPLTVLKLPMQKWEISKCQSAADTAIKGSQSGPERAWGVWWWWRWKRGGGLSYESSHSENQLIISRASASLCRVLARGDSRQVISSSVTLFAQSDSHWNIVYYTIRWQQGTPTTGTLSIKISSKTPLPAIHCVGNAKRNVLKLRQNINATLT